MFLPFPINSFKIIFSNEHPYHIEHPTLLVYYTID